MSKQKESGFVSIITAVLLMVVLSLITLGFTRLMQREQRQAIDRQLSRTALYAAESGVNDVLEAIDSGPYSALSNKTTCDASALPSSNLSLDGNVAVTCAMFDNQPGSLVYDIDTNSSKIVQMKTASGNNFLRFIVSFGGEAGSNDVTLLPPCGSSAAEDFPDVRPGAPPVMRFDLTSIPMAPATPYDRATLIQRTDYLYVSPCNGAGSTSVPFNTSARGRVAQANCALSGAQEPCAIEIVIPLAPDALASNTFFARIRPIYADAVLSISATEDTSPGVDVAKFVDAQVSVDVTAKASDVVRRLRVSVPFNTSVEVPEAVLHVFDGICKRIEYTPAPLGTVDQCNPAPPPPPTVQVCDTTTFTITIVLVSVQSADPVRYQLPATPCGFTAAVPPGDGYSPTLAGGRIFNLFHHTENKAVIVCHDLNLNPCLTSTGGFIEIPGYVTAYNSNLVSFNGNLYFTARQWPTTATTDIGIGCYNYTANTFCGFTPLAASDFTSSQAVTATANNNAGVGSLVRVGSRLFTLGIDTAGRTNIYCAEVLLGSLVPCPGFTPYDINAPIIAPNAIPYFITSFSSQGSRLLFTTSSSEPSHRSRIGCYDTSIQNTCAGWVVRNILPSVENNAAVLVGGSLCLANNIVFGTNFAVECFSAADGSSVSVPSGYLTQAPTIATNNFWSNFDPFYDGSKIYLSAFNFSSNGAATYCYDTSIQATCVGWGGDNGWQNGMSSGNNFGNFYTYVATRFGSCMYGIGDNPLALLPSIIKFSPVDGGPCTP